MPAVRNRKKARGWVRMPHAGIQLAEELRQQRLALAARDVLHVERAVHHDHAHDRGADGDLRRDHEGGRPLPAEERVVVGRGPARHHEAVDAQRDHAQHVEDAHVERHRLELDLAPQDLQGVAERDRREGGQAEEHRHERGELEHQLVRARGGEVLLGQHLDRVGQRVEQPQDANAEAEHGYGRAVGPDPVLHDRGLLALDPGQEPAEVQHHEHDEPDRDRLEQQIEGDAAHAFTTRPASPIAR